MLKEAGQKSQPDFEGKQSIRTLPDHFRVNKRLKWQAFKTFPVVRFTAVTFLSPRYPGKSHPVFGINRQSLPAAFLGNTNAWLLVKVNFINGGNTGIATYKGVMREFRSLHFGYN